MNVSTTCRTVLAVCALSAGFACAGDFRLMSSSIGPELKLSLDQVFNGFGCSGKNISPALEWSGAPAATRSFAITVYDPDAPTGSGWWHWLVYNLPATATRLPAGAGAEGGAALPAGAQMGRTDYGSRAFGGACPPPGAPHRYVFTVHALKSERLDVPADASAAMIGFFIGANRLDSASFTATYGR